MGVYIMFVDWKNKVHKYFHFSHFDLYVQCNPYQTHNVNMKYRLYFMHELVGKLFLKINTPLTTAILLPKFLECLPI